LKDWCLSPVLTGQNKETKKGILTVKTSGEKEGSDLAKELLYENTDSDTVLFLSGGRTPEYLYSELAREQKLKIGAAAMVDERYGKPLHDNSNDLIIKRTGLSEYFERAGIPLYPILTEGLSIENTATNYEAELKDLLARFPQSVAILGIGEDGHVAGIAPNRPDFTNPVLLPEHRDWLVSYFVDPRPMSKEGNSMPPHGFGKRITMTIKGLSILDALIILVFGEKKKLALSRLFEEGPIELLPARFIKNKNVFKKTLIITDQKV
jgi:6-phosphogluconolactonase/glucosamine-6-phosphate isomerase/deaminase